MPNITVSAAVDTFLQAASQSAMRTTLGLGTAAVEAASAFQVASATLTALAAGLAFTPFTRPLKNNKGFKLTHTNRTILINYTAGTA